MPSEIVRPSHHYKVALRKCRRQALELTFLPNISEEFE